MDKWPPTQPPLPLLFFIISCLFNSCHWMITCSYLAIPSMCFFFFIASFSSRVWFSLFFSFLFLLALWYGLVGFRARVTYRRHFAMHSKRHHHYHHYHRTRIVAFGESVTSLKVVACMHGIELLCPCEIESLTDSTYVLLLSQPAVTYASSVCGLRCGGRCNIVLVFRSTIFLRFLFYYSSRKTRWDARLV